MTAVAKAEIQNSRTRKEWAEIISSEWALAEGHAVKAVDYAISTGQWLIEAKAELGHGEFLEMVKSDDVPFQRTKAANLMAIANNEILSNVRNSEHLPKPWNTLYKLSKMSGEDIKDAQSKGLIDEKTTYKEAGAIAGAYKTPEGETWGEGHSPLHLPTKKDANEIARETGRGIAANDGNIYFGHTKDEADAIDERMTTVHDVRDAVKALSSIEIEPADFLEYALPHQLWTAAEDDEIDAAKAWLDGLAIAWRTRK